MDDDQTDADNLKFGSAFTNPSSSSNEEDVVAILSCAEVFRMTTQFNADDRRKYEESDEYSDRRGDNAVLSKVHLYGHRFNGKGAEEGSTEAQQSTLINILGDLRNSLLQKSFIDVNSGVELKLHEYEVSKLIDLMSTTSETEEAKCLIPSLRRFADSNVTEYLELVRASKAKIAEI